MLTDMGYVAQMVQLEDNNKIDAAIALFRPDLVVLEAFWVVPSKLDVLIPKWPNVKWAVRNHSDVPFIANEGIATEWLYGYWSRGVMVMSNDPVAMNDFQTIAWSYGRQEFYDLNAYAPNYYPLDIVPPLGDHHGGDNVFDIGCFGAIRPLKNQLQQAVAAIQFCQQTRRRLRFHINASRIEQVGSPVLRNLRALFSHTYSSQLVEHPWLEHDEFVDLMQEMDFCMCVSFSETFCIVGADAVSAGVPLIGSKEIPWLGEYAIADPTVSNDMVYRLMRAEMLRREWVRAQWHGLQDYNEETQRVWRSMLRTMRKFR